MAGLRGGCEGSPGDQLASSAQRSTSRPVSSALEQNTLSAVLLSGSTLDQEQPDSCLGRAGLRVSTKRRSCRALSVHTAVAGEQE